MRTKSIDMLSGNITGGLLALTIPIMIMNVASSLFGVVDTALLKALGHESAVGAVGACGMLITLSTSLLIGISAGANVVVSKHLGAGDKERSERSISTALIFAFAAGILLMIIGATMAETLLTWTNCHESLLKDAASYFRIYFYGVPPLMLYYFCASILRAHGDTKSPMYFLFVSGTLKIILTYLFVILFDRAIVGVALATAFSNIFVCTLSLAVLLKKFFKVKKESFRIDWVELRAILFNGIPAGLQSALYSLANVIITSVVNTFGPAATTGVAIANQYDGILYQISYAPSLATIPYIARNVGAGNYKRVGKVLARGVLITAAFGASLGALSAIFSPQLSYMLSSSDEVVGYSVQKMIIVSSTYFICGINEVLGGALKGLGKPVYPALTSLVFMCILRFIWVYFIFPYAPSLTFLYTVWPIGWTLSIITLSIVYACEMKKIRSQSAKTSALNGI